MIVSVMRKRNINVDGQIAQDEAMRSYDADGRLHVKQSHITKANVCPYYGSEIPGWYKLGLSANKVYYLLRSPEELEKAAPTFARLPILSKHVPITADSLPEELVIGSIGSDINWNAPYLDADLCFWRTEAIGAIETESVKELSSAYRYEPDMTPGEYEGQQYDGIMRNIRGNHLCLVEDGRAGSDVVVADSNPFKREEIKMTKLGKALLNALSLASPKLAQDSALPALVENAKKKGFDKPAFKAKLIAMDGELPPEQLDAVIDALLDVQEDPNPVVPPAPTAGDGGGAPAPAPAPVAQESKKDKLKKLLSGKIDESILNEALGIVGDEEPPKPKEDDKKKLDAAMDSLRKELKEADEARRAVRPVVGEVIAQDSAAGIYKFALDHMGVKYEGVEDATALKALFNVANTNKPAAPAVALDAGGLIKKFPGAARFRQA